MGRDLTLGIEEEYQVCDPRTGDLVPGVERLLQAAAIADPALRDRMAFELLHTVLEVNTAVAESVDDALAKILRLRREVHGIAGATLSSQAVTGGVRRVLALHEVLVRPRVARHEP